MTLRSNGIRVFRAEGTGGLQHDAVPEAFDPADQGTEQSIAS